MSGGGGQAEFLEMGKEDYLFLCSVLLPLLKFLRIPSYGVGNVLAGR